MKKFTADLHLHSRFSRAVSQQMTLPNMAVWAKRKGIDVLATADWTHPVWMSTIKNDLVEQGNGLLRVKGRTSNDPHFLLSSEISSIYAQDGRGYRIHTVMVVPTIEIAEKVNATLTQRGVNVSSDGRPITGISARDLLALLLEIDARNYLIPAHVWTPWFSLYGSKSGFDSITDCFGDLSKEVFAVETGLSSDAGMNWRLSELDTRSIVSFSDAHSLEKMGRELTIFSGEISYEGIKAAMKEGTIRGTIEFFPEEGKYHWTGHRNCGVRQSAEETREKGTTCPKCKRPLTVGVEHRVDELADRRVAELNVYTDTHGWTRSRTFPGRPPFRRLVPLHEILAEALESGVKTQTVSQAYDRAIAHFGSELEVLLKATPAEMQGVLEARVIDGIEKVRAGNIVIDPGYDNAYGVVKIWGEEEKPTARAEQQIGLF